MDNFYTINNDVLSPYIILCEHAGNKTIDEFNFSDEILKTCDAYDIGAKEVAMDLAKKLNCYAIFGELTRLIVDLNRSNLNEIIPEKYKINDENDMARINKYYLPFHDEVNRRINFLLEKGVQPKLIAIHSFDKYGRASIASNGVELGILYNKKQSLGDKCFSTFRDNSDFNVKINEPYDLSKIKSGSVIKHAEEKGFDYFGFEFRDDLFSSIVKIEKIIELLIKSLK